MFERFTDRARRIIVLAQDEARMLKHEHVGTEHVLLGIIDEGECLAACTLESLGIDLGVIRRQIETIIGVGAIEPSGNILFTPRSKKVLELAMRESWQLDQNYVGTEHILLGLIREGENVGAQVLVNVGADLNRVRERVTQIVSGEYNLSTLARSGRVFVSYRREDTRHIAGRLSDRLIDQLGDDQVFMDVDSIELGVDYREVISNAIEKSDILLTIIGHRWLTTEDEGGGRRLFDSDDLVRLEIEAALRRNIRVIPVLVDGAVMPKAQELPASLSTLARLNALHVRHETFHQDAQRLQQAVQKVLGSKRTRIGD